MDEPTAASEGGNPRKYHNPQGKESRTMDGIASDKVNINVGGGGEGGGYGGASMAALVAALGQRNQGNDHAALIAALGNRNDSGANLAPLFALMGHRDNDGFGQGGLWPIILLALLGRHGGFGGFGGGGDCCDGSGGGHFHGNFLQSILNSLTGLTAAVPTTALETQNAIQGAIAQLALAGQQGFSNLKDSVQAIGAANLAATNNVASSVIQQGLTTQIAIGHDGDKTRALIQSTNMDNLQRQLTVAQNALMEERFDRRGREVEVNVSQNVNQQQAQQQQQLQFQDLVRRFDHLCNLQVLNARQAQDIVNLGTMTASGTQAAANTQVR